MDNRTRGKVLAMMASVIGSSNYHPPVEPQRPKRKPQEMTRGMFEKAKRFAGFRNKTMKPNGAKECARRVKQLASGAISNYYPGCQYPDSPQYKFMMEARRMSQAAHPALPAAAPTAAPKINFGTSFNEN